MIEFCLFFHNFVKISGEILDKQTNFQENMIFFINF